MTDRDELAKLVELLAEGAEDAMVHVRRGAGHVCDACGRSWPCWHARAVELLATIDQGDDRTTSTATTMTTPAL